MKNSRFYRFLISPPVLIFIASLAFNLIFVLKIHPPWQHLYADMQGYIERANNLAQGKHLKPYDTFYPAGTTYLFAVFFVFFSYHKALTAIAIFQVVLLSLSNVLVYKIVLDFYRSRLGAILAMGFCVAYFPFISYAGFYMSEVSFFFFSLLSIYLILVTFTQKKGLAYPILAGLAIGLSVIIRSSFFPAFIFFAVLAIFSQKSRNWQKIIVFFVCSLLVISTQVIRNSEILKKLTFVSTNGGLNTYLGQAHLRSAGHYAVGNTYLFYNNNSFWDKTLTRDAEMDFNIWEDAEFYNASIDLWRVDFWKQLKVTLRNGVEQFYIVGHWPIRNSGQSQPWLVILDRICQYIFSFLVLLPVAFIFIAKVCRRKFSFVDWVMFIPLFSVVLMAMATKGEERYFVPAQFLLIAFVSPYWVKALSNIFHLKKTGFL